MKKKIIRNVFIAFIVIGLGITFLLYNNQSKEKGDYPDEQKHIVSSEVKEESENPVENHTSGQSESSNIRSWFEEEKDVSEKVDDHFPYSIPNSTLSIRAVKSYSGVYIEDGSDKDISNIAAIILDNKGNENIEYAKITLPYGEKEYIFEAKTLAAGATMVVQESTGAKYVEGEYGEATVVVATMEKMEMSEKSVELSETESGALKIANISGENIPCVRIFYKFYLEDIGVSVGGITYTSKITELKAGETRVITPSHYDKDASRVMMVRTYDTY